MATNREPMEVCIDGSCQTVQNYATSTLWKQPWVKAELSAGVHDVIIRNTIGGTIGFDAAKTIGLSHTWHYKYDGLSRLREACSQWNDTTRRR
jgi:hypothetical protein